MSRKYAEMAEETEGKDKADANADKKEKKEPKKPFNWRRLLSLSYPERYHILAGTVALVISSSIGLLLIGMVGVLVDSITEEDPEAGYETLNRTVLFLIIAFVFGAVMSFFRAMLFNVAGERVVTRLRRQLFHHIIEQEIAFFDEHRTGEIISRLADDCGVLQNACTTNISMLLRNLVTLAGSLFNILFISWRLTGVMLSVVPILAIGAVKYGKFVKGISKKVQDATAEATTAAEESLSNVRTVRSFCGEGNAQAAYAERLDVSFQLARKRAIAYGAFTGGMFLVGNFGLILVLYYGGTLVLSQELSVGDLTSFALFTVGIAAALGIITSLYNDFMKGIGASQRVFELLDREAVVPIQGGDAIVTNMQGAIDFVGVTFAYPSRSDQSVLQDVTLRVDAGQTVAIVGPSGGGKSTIVQLIKRFYDPVEGKILIDGVKLTSLNRASYMRNVASVMQEPILFATTIKKNITYGLSLDDEPTAAQVEEAAKSSNSWEFISRFPDGLETMVGERGVRLSGGQKQRIAIARALMKRPRLLILDEATSALDSESEALVQVAIDRLIEEHGRTTLIIAHRLSTIRNSDSILVIESGKLAQQGTHDELLEQGGVYSQLISKQVYGKIEG